MDRKTVYLKMLEALAVGDALGMPTEFMKREDIREKFGLVDRLLDPSVSWLHANLPKGSVTDDTEQNLYLIEAYCKDRVISVENTAEHLLRWVKETKADEKKYIGPSSLKALNTIAEGEDPYKAGANGTTCGGVMRVLSAVLCSDYEDEHQLQQAVLNCCIPTHHTAFAVEAAMAFAYALRGALRRESLEEIVEASIRGAVIGRALPEHSFSGPSTAGRIRLQQKLLPTMNSNEDVLDFIYSVIGTGLESYEVGPAVIGVFMWAKDDVWLAARMGASVGGDSDTVAALAALLSAAYAGGHNIPQSVVDEVVQANNLDLPRYAQWIDERQRQLRTGQERQ